ncbi:cryptochrome/photolyase family protein [Nostocoides jenkinsii]|jgi:deoxyribodipyrimidine photo-lyase|uniref:Deoxyribodipyrimidine photo-lyase n=1 Tax=Nostocoides jenkinsii Ben 74 TaxID=1193518 RepID=A0A077MFF0_9MICO|nr:deoxyribodipyrimidine photo-lyase [Tetrasphaera jenkinsii]CCI53937.1 Deoxyribodipyrimidine photo-lyase [Tetrasphaera jenkinsii Ben 74]
MTAVMWFRRDLRLADNPALASAAEAGAIVPLVVLDPRLLGEATRPRDRAYLQAVAALDASLGGRLVIRTGDPATVVPAVCAETGARGVHVSGESTPYGRRRDTAVAQALAAADVGWHPLGGPYAVGPGRVRTRTGDPFQVFTPFARAWREHGWRPPIPRPTGLRTTAADSETLPTTADHPSLPVTEEQAAAAWREFTEGALATYAEDRDRPDLDGTSALSVALKLGTIHPRTLLQTVAADRSPGAEVFVTELAWREFYADVLWHHPSSAWRDLKGTLRSLPYADPADPLIARRISAWREGRTGYPLVDAGMRALAKDGWLHNRVRMVVASFLVKDLHVWWPVGARHFLDLLADGDLASNSHGWQWVAGTGTDAAPYFRIFNPVAQGKRFDPDGTYVRRHVPELAHLGGAAVHEPWRAGDGYAHGYPSRIVDHGDERAEALERYAAARHT